MHSPNLVKFVAAFVAGVVIALGSALIYIRVSETVHPEPVSLAQTAPDPAPPPLVQTPPVQTPLPKAPPPPAEPVTAQPVIVPPPPAKPLIHRQPKATPVHLAQNRMPLGERVTYTSLPAALPPAAPVDALPAEALPSNDPAPQAPDVSPGPQPHVITLEAGTTIPISLSEMLSTDHNYTGDTFRGSLAAPIVMDGFIIADRGSKVLGRVVTSEKAGRVEGRADLTVTLTEINTTDGQRIRVDTNSVERRGQASVGEDAAKIAGGAALGAIIGAMAGGGKGAAIGAGVGGAAGTGVVFASRGRAANIPAESKLTFRLATPLTITEKLH